MVGATVAMSGLGKISRKEQMEVLVKKRLEEDENGKWKIPLGDDRIAIRDLAGYVVSIVDWGKEFVGTALESSPYGSIAWAGVCLLLPVSTFSAPRQLTWWTSFRTSLMLSIVSVSLVYDNVISAPVLIRIMKYILGIYSHHTDSCSAYSKSFKTKSVKYLRSGIYL